MSGTSIKRILLVEDNPGDGRLLVELLGEHNAYRTEVTLVQSMSEAEAHLTEHVVDILLLDLGLPDVQGLAAVRRSHSAAPHVPLVVLTGSDDDEMATLALREGAQDYLIKGQIDARGLLRALRYAGERKRLECLKDSFVSTVSHELRTPLTSISGSLGLLMGKGAGTLPEPVVRLLTIAHSNCQRLVRLVNDILDSEKLGSGSAVFNFGRVEVRSLVEEVMSANQGFAEIHGVPIQFEDASDAFVRADPDRLVQVVTNLLSNAIKFSPAGHEVVVAVEKDAEVVRISIRDHGPGISVDFGSRAFERFAQADATDARQKGGTGLGLSIVKQIVDRLGGNVGFANEPDGGTTFHVELPSWEHVVRMGIGVHPQLNASRQ